MRASDFAYFDARTPIGMAHRGGAKFGPNRGLENTHAAFQRAVDLGYRYLETDVHATADGVLLAFHDTRLDRVTDGTGAIAALPYDTVRRATIGGREPIPLMADLLDAFPGARFNIDIKAPGAIEPLVRLIQDRKALDRICIGSFSERRLRAARRLLGPELATAAGQVGTALLRFSPKALLPLLTTPAPVLQIPATHTIQGREIRLVTRELVNRVHAAGKQVHVWTIDERDEMNDLLDLGVDGLVSDRIDILADVLAERGAPLR